MAVIQPASTQDPQASEFPSEKGRHLKGSDLLFMLIMFNKIIVSTHLGHVINKESFWRRT